MTRFITTIMLLVGVCAMPVYIAADDNNRKVEPKDLLFNDENVGANGRPKMPAYCPFYGVMDNFNLTLFSNISGEVEILITDSVGMAVLEDYADLSGGYIIPLEENIDYGIIYLTIGSKTYKAIL